MSARLEAVIPNPRTTLRRLGIDIPKEAFETWWDIMSEAIFNKLMRGMMVVSGGKLGTFGMYRRAGRKGWGTIYLEHIRARRGSGKCNLIFVLGKFRDASSRNYQLRMRNLVFHDPSQVSRFPEFRSKFQRDLVKNDTYLDRRPDPDIMAACEYASKKTEIPAETFIRAHRVWTKFVGDHMNEKERYFLKWYCINGSASSHDTGNIMRHAIAEWKAETGDEYPVRNLGKWIEKVYRTIIYRYALKDEEIVTRCSTFEDTLDLFYERITKDGAKISRECTRYLLYIIMRKNIGNVVLPFVISNEKLREQLKKEILKSKIMEANKAKTPIERVINRMALASGQPIEVLRLLIMIFLKELKTETLSGEPIILKEFGRLEVKKVTSAMSHNTYAHPKITFSKKFKELVKDNSEVLLKKLGEYIESPERRKRIERLSQYNYTASKKGQE